MPAEPPDFDLERILTTLDRHDVRYLLVGGLGARAHGATRPTQDVDFVLHSTRENLERLATAMRELGARLRVARLRSAHVSKRRSSDHFSARDRAGVGDAATRAIPRSSRTPRWLRVRWPVRPVRRPSWALGVVATSGA